MADSWEDMSKQGSWGPSKHKKRFRLFGLQEKGEVFIAESYALHGLKTKYLDHLGTMCLGCFDSKKGQYVSEKEMCEAFNIDPKDLQQFLEAFMIMNACFERMKNS